MTHTIRTLLLTVLTATALQALAAGPAVAQMPSRHGQPKTPFSTIDFAKIRWLEGPWTGVSPGEAPIYQRFHFVNDSTAEIAYFRDAGFQQQMSQGRLYLSVGRVYHTFGASRWAASRVDTNGVYFVPQEVARNTYAWMNESPDSWKSTLRTGVGGQERVTVYEMKRAQ
jgi:hypothetical protein